MNDVIILGKGNSVNRLTHDEINSHETIVWCNIHNDLTCDNIPSRVNYVYLRESCFVTDLPEANIRHLEELKIQKIFSTKNIIKNFGKRNILNINVSNEAIEKTYFEKGFNPSTGLIAFHHICLLNPKKITLVGLDNFEKNKKLYYHDIKDSLTSKSNLNGLILNTTDDEILTRDDFHFRDKTIQKIVSLINEHPNIEFIIISEDDKLNNSINNIKNLKIAPVEKKVDVSKLSKHQLREFQRTGNVPN